MCVFLVLLGALSLLAPSACCLLRRSAGVGGGARKCAPASPPRLPWLRLACLPRPLVACSAVPPGWGAGRGKCAPASPPRLPWLRLHRLPRPLFFFFPLLPFFLDAAPFGLRYIKKKGEDRCRSPPCRFNPRGMINYILSPRIYHSRNCVRRYNGVKGYHIST